MRKIHDHIATITRLKQHSLKGAGVIEAYHARRVAPLMAPSAPLIGTVLAQEALCDSEIAQRIKDATTVDDLDFVFPIPGHPTMSSNTCFVDLVSFSFWFSPN
jgi:hypothetical protein